MGRKPKTNLPNDLVKTIRRVGANLHYYRLDAELTQAELSKAAQVSVTTINEMEARRCRDMRLSTLVSLAKALDVPLIKFFGESDLKLGSEDKQKLLRASEDLAVLIRKLKDE